ncbi:MAG: right-handed parallel beta-helix repeat-containing protein [Candidatus Omnitrophica bacterium]|nr:right-handed parallel beta-helix repeat-containing protein [Candidatus Omnitrophota bacterium]
MKMRILLMIALMISLAQNAFAAEYYMSPFGNDSNPGTLAAPWRTMDRLQDAQSSLHSGDTVYFRAGDYLATDASRFENYSWRAKGVTYKNYATEVPVLIYDKRKLNTVDGGKIFIFLGEGVTVDGLSLKMTEASRSTGMNGHEIITRRGNANSFSTWASDVTIKNCTIDNFSAPAIYVHGENIMVEHNTLKNLGSHGFYVAGKDGTYRYNYIDGSRGYPLQNDIQIQYETSIGNKIYGNILANGQMSGVVFSGSVSNNEVFNNILINSGDNKSGSGGFALALFCQQNLDGSPATARPGNKFYNNTAIGRIKSRVVDTVTGTPAGTYCLGMMGGRALAENVAIYNNIFYPSSPPQYSMGNISTIKNNIFYNIPGSVPAGNTMVNPNLVNPNGITSADAMLQAGSPAIDQATSGAPTLDYRSGARPVGAAADVGAFEYGAPPGSGGGPVGGGSPSDPTFPCI